MPFPIRTERLLLRPVRPSDAMALAKRRTDPAVAKHQDWSVPYSLDDAERLIAGAIAARQPTPGRWWMLSVADLDDSAVYGDIAIRLDDLGHSAEIGYTFSSEHWGNGYATEAVESIVAWLLRDVGVARIQGTMNPDNLSSARVLERVGFLYEGRLSLAFWDGKEATDDLVYGLTTSGWREWTERVVAKPDSVDLVTVTTDNYEDLYRLQTHHSQRRYVSSVADSFADALFPEVWEGHPVVPWMRGVRADGVWVGFVMLAEVTEHHVEPYLWRLLVDRLHQRRGIGTRILDQVTDVARAMGSRSLSTSWEEGPGSPRPFYERYGFNATGRVVEGETEGRLIL